jgi:hypothetical protein
MSSQRTGTAVWLRRGVPAAALMALVCAAALAGGAGPAAAAPHHGDALPARSHPAVAPGTVSTIAGGIGGPAKATTVGVIPIGLTFSGGHLYVASSYGFNAIRDIAPDDELTTLAGSKDAPQVFGGPATASGLGDSAVAVDHHGNLVIADGLHIAVVAARTGTF